MTSHLSVVTGANTGLGLETARALARRGDRVLFAGRSEESNTAAIAEVRADTGNSELEHLSLDLADLDSVRRAGRELVDRGDPIDVVVANAGVAGQRGVTAQGWELAFGVNHLGHFLFVTEVLPMVRAAGDAGVASGDGPARVVVVASGSHYDATAGIDFDALHEPTRSVTGLPEYAVSKLANVLFAQELARRERPDEVLAVSLHPGNLIGTDVLRRAPGWLNAIYKRFRPSPAEGARTSIMCATSPEVLGHDGAYYSVGQLKEPSPVATSELAAELWRRSEEWTAPT